MWRGARSFLMRSEVAYREIQVRPLIGLLPSEDPMRNLPRTAPGCSRTLHFRCERAPYTQPTRRAKKKKKTKNKNKKNMAPHFPPTLSCLCFAVQQARRVGAGLWQTLRGTSFEWHAHSFLESGTETVPLVQRKQIQTQFEVPQLDCVCP